MKKKILQSMIWLNARFVLFFKVKVIQGNIMDGIGTKQLRFGRYPQGKNFYDSGSCFMFLPSTIVIHIHTCVT